MVDDFLQWWSTLPFNTQRAIVCSVFVLIVVRTFGVTNSLLFVGAAWYLNRSLPSEASFLPFFEQWFKREYFQKLAERLKYELDQRSTRQKSLLDSLSDKVQSWFVGSTKGLQSTFVYELLDRRPMFSDMHVCRFASINISSRAQPAYVSFVGVHGYWYLAPWHSIDFNNISILDEIDSARANRTDRSASR
mmetsp:Transcript_9382/g.27337  ORF Transcript_9382/g.27337 Transcript_9382/m.27337 type:complete len:191 (-) Transcript_9382:89-661(-)